MCLGDRKFFFDISQKNNRELPKKKKKKKKNFKDNTWNLNITLNR